ncbi:unnamed protein product [Lactuca virosa]|uniref:Uncharacterized protein n=1 Tax=Lactuca virosa TaxID=75947 RepID=A0AAU9NTD7_9ASTR|nr:unnamed protein product [Lactuca virosa]
MPCSSGFKICVLSGCKLCSGFTSYLDYKSSSDHWDVRDNLFHDDGDDNREEAANYNSSLFLVLFRSIKLFYL